MMIRILLILTMLASVTSCQKNEETYISDNQYFPLEVGQYQIFEVAETTYSISAQPIERKFYLREQITEKYTNGNAEFIYKIERSKRANTNQAWKVDSVWTAELQPNKALRTENNITFIKLLFPVENNTFWNRNEYNKLPSKKVSYGNIGQVVDVNTKTFTKTISVIIENDSSLLSKNRNLEIYAPNYGVIYQEDIHLAYCQSSPTCIGKKIIDYGTDKKVKLIEMGVSK